MKQERTFIVDILFVLALFGVFAFCAMALVTVGADVYRHTVEDMSSNYEVRTGISYLTEKIRQNDSSKGGAELTEFYGETALRLTQAIDGETYYTYLYLHEGYLKELFVKKGLSLGGDAQAAGQNILELESLKLEWAADNLLSIQMTAKNSREMQVLVNTRCN